MNNILKFRTLFNPLRLAMYDFTESLVRKELNHLVNENARIHMCYPINNTIGPDNFYEKSLKKLYLAFPDLERRDYIVMSGITEKDYSWVGTCGIYCGTFVNSFFDIPATGHLAHMRYHEFYKFEDNMVTEIQAIWDIPELMIQANAWPMAPSLGKEWCVPGPSTMDGINKGDVDLNKSNNSLEHIVSMANAMKRHPSEGGPELMELEKFWHPKMNWYGPSAIGTSRGIEGFRNWHQIPFLNAMPDRGELTTYEKRDGRGEDISYHFFSENDYVAVTGWPNMKQTISHDGWLGIPPINKQVYLRSLDFWRLEKGKIRENWVLVDILDIYNQIGVDVFARLNEFNKANSKGA